jgi:hypothetical protein
MIGGRIVKFFKYTVAFIVALAIFSGIMILSSYITETLFGWDTDSFVFLVVFIAVFGCFLYAFERLDKFIQTKFPGLYEHLKTWVPRG